MDFGSELLFSTVDSSGDKPPGSLKLFSRSIKEWIESEVLDAFRVVFDKDLLSDTTPIHVLDSQSELGRFRSWTQDIVKNVLQLTMCSMR